MKLPPIIDRITISKATRRIREAEKSLQELVTLQQSPLADDFDERWFEFLVALNSVHEVIETGSKRHPKSRQWYAKKKRLIRSDPLLSYLLQSRGIDFHGDAKLFVLRLSHGDFRYHEHAPADQNPPKQQGVFDIPDHVKSVKLWYEPQTVIDRRNNRFDPPTTHLGNPLQSAWPTAMGYAALFFYEKLLHEAFELT